MLSKVEMRDDCVLKKYDKEDAVLYHNEKYFYLRYQRYHPRLYWFDDNTRTLCIERCIPIMDIKDNIVYRDRLWQLLSDLHDEGVNHRDVALVNVVVKDDKVLLIDWESATKNIGSVSADLYGQDTAGLTHHWDYGPEGVWWGGPWDICPAMYWKEKQWTE